MRAPASQDPSPSFPMLRWLVIWALLTVVYASAVLLHRALSRDGGAWWTVDREDLTHLGVVPLVETGALALVVRLRRRP